MSIKCVERPPDIMVILASRILITKTNRALFDWRQIYLYLLIQQEDNIFLPDELLDINGFDSAIELWLMVYTTSLSSGKYTKTIVCIIYNFFIVVAEL